MVVRFQFQPTKENVLTKLIKKWEKLLQQPACDHAICFNVFYAIFLTMGIITDNWVFELRLSFLKCRNNYLLLKKSLFK
ncbi:hypothetical protein NPIL_119221 [Nephila pilipes]|uniref:Uncharacterized protein n=1 Tax=Nephila pilipes TaxID=299642 RepID=A0A8X6UW04_NEPPI|nr:hypothetical protein NPIL_119221 [Nephila pilipes]